MTASATLLRLSLVPTGVGETRPLATGRVTGFTLLNGGAKWMPDGQRIALVGRESGRPERVFIQSLAGGEPEAVTPEGVFGPFVVSRDSSMIIVRDQKGQLWKYLVGGGAPTVVAGALPGDEPLSWSPGGEFIWVLNRRAAPATIVRLGLQDGRRTPWRDLPYDDPAAIESGQLRVVMSADGSKFVYGYHRHLSELYVANGLR